ncbi:hypothetical protein [Saccharopolyspora gloriosae]|uniref:hypothetical protein n=1 Tax=Saccharopolyspora gloriosae TaxID=455344 RepID=UPI001FB7C4ED|nr:hypothetical protein [Saccharopolyspora gloriosae]
MTGFRIDPEALEGAIRKLEEARDEAQELAQSSRGAMPKELTAKDSITGEARALFTDRVNGADASLQGSANAMIDKLTAKIEAYRATLDEYRSADENASVDAGQIERRS